jgi:hypothetical protein
MILPRSGRLFGLLFVTSLFIGSCAAKVGGNPSTSPLAVVSPTETYPASVTPTELTPTYTQTPSSSPSPISTPIPSSTPTEISTATETPLPAGQYTITVHNPYQWDAHIFVDNLYLMTIRPDESDSYEGFQAGSHTFHYCQAKQMLSCTPLVSININADTELEMGELAASQPTPTNIATIVVPSPSVPTLGFVFQTTNTIKVNNLYPWRIYIFLDDELFLSIPAKRYLTFRGLLSGKYTFVHCHDKKMKYCFTTREIIIEGDTEWYVSP